MGGKVGQILPLVAMAAAAYFTGGAALAGMAPAAGGATTAGLAGFQQASLALSAATAITGISGAAANAQAQKQALAIQAEQQRVQQLSDKLAITQQEAAAQKNLRKVLAAQTVAFNARGIDPSSGSPFALQEGAYHQTGDEMDLLATKRKQVEMGAQLSAADLANRRKGVSNHLSQSIIGSLLDLGKGVNDELRPKKK
jgi:hypothetical protein